MRLIIAIAVVLPLLGCSASVETTLAGMVLGNRDSNRAAIGKETVEADGRLQNENIPSKGRKDPVEVADEKQKALNELLSLRTELSVIEAPVQTSNRGNLLDLRDNHANRMSERIKRSASRIEQESSYQKETDTDGN